MSLIAEFSIVSPLMREAKAVPEMVFHTEDLHMTQEGEAKHIYWASGGDFDALESALQDDRTTKKYTCLTEFDGRRLYRVTYPEDAVQELLYPKAAKYDMVYLDVRTNQEESRFRARVPLWRHSKRIGKPVKKRGSRFVFTVCIRKNLRILRTSSD